MDRRLLPGKLRVEPHIDDSNQDRDNLGNRKGAYMDCQAFKVFLDEWLFYLSVDTASFLFRQHSFCAALSDHVPLASSDAPTAGGTPAV